MSRNRSQDILDAAARAAADVPGDPAPGLTIECAADAMQTTRGRVRRWVRLGAPCVRKQWRGRKRVWIDLAALRAWVAEQQRPAGVIEVAGPRVCLRRRYWVALAIGDPCRSCQPGKIKDGDLAGEPPSTPREKRLGDGRGRGPWVLGELRRRGVGESVWLRCGRCSRKIGRAAACEVPTEDLAAITAALDACTGRAAVGA